MFCMVSSEIHERVPAGFIDRFLGDIQLSFYRFKNAEVDCEHGIIRLARVSSHFNRDEQALNERTKYFLSLR